MAQAICFDGVSRVGCSIRAKLTLWHLKAVLLFANFSGHTGLLEYVRKRAESTIADDPAAEKELRCLQVKAELLNELGSGNAERIWHACQQVNMASTDAGVVQPCDAEDALRGAALSQRVECIQRALSSAENMGQTIVCESHMVVDSLPAAVDAGDCVASDEFFGLDVAGQSDTKSALQRAVQIENERRQQIWLTTGRIDNTASVATCTSRVVVNSIHRSNDSASVENSAGTCGPNGIGQDDIGVGSQGATRNKHWKQFQRLTDDLGTGEELPEGSDSLDKLDRLSKAMTCESNLLRALTHGDVEEIEHACQVAVAVGVGRKLVLKAQEQLMERTSVGAGKEYHMLKPDSSLSSRSPSRPSRPSRPSSIGKYSNITQQCPSPARPRKAVPPAFKLFEQSLQRWHGDDDCSHGLGTSKDRVRIVCSKDRVRMRRVRKEELLHALQGKDGAHLKEACRLADFAGVDSRLIDQAWGKARQLLFEVELQQAIESNDCARIEHACRLAGEIEIDDRLVAKAEAAARRLRAKATALSALSSGDLTRIEHACRKAELAGVDDTILSPLKALSRKLRHQRKLEEISEARQSGDPARIERACKNAAGVDGVDAATVEAALKEARSIRMSVDRLQEQQDGSVRDGAVFSASQIPPLQLQDTTPQAQRTPRARSRSIKVSSAISAKHTSGIVDADTTFRMGDEHESVLASLVDRGLLCSQSQRRDQEPDDLAYVANRFRTELPEANVVSVMRIENPSLVTVYDAVRSTTSVAREMELWHGTSKESARNIILNGFNRAYCGRHGARYGNGTYFSAKVAYSTRFCDKKAGHRLMFVAKVLVGEWAKGSPGLMEPPHKDREGLTRYDSTVDNVECPSIFCVFRDFQAIPLYLVEFV